MEIPASVYIDGSRSQLNYGDSLKALVVQRIEWEIPNFQIGVRFPSEVLFCLEAHVMLECWDM